MVIDDTLPIGSPPTLEEYHRRNGATLALLADAPVRRKPGRPATRKAKRRRRWPPGRSCDRCGAALSEYQSRYCSNACRYPDRPVAESGAAMPEPAEASSDDGHEPSGVLELLTRSNFQLVSVELVLGGERWLLTRQG